MIQIQNAYKKYKKGKNIVHAINDTSIVFPDRGLVSIVGKSGSGKTSFLNYIGGLDKAKGLINYDGKVFKDYQMDQIDHFRNIYFGYIFQNYLLLPSKTVYENLEIQLNLIGIYDHEEINKRIDYCLGLVDMLDYKRRNCASLSGGQQQRIAIARALIKNAQCLICDEPTGNLDSKNTEDIMRILKSISKNKLVLLVTHDLDMANLYSDRIILISDGKINDIKENNTENNTKLDKHNFYLQEYNKETFITGNIKINLYSKEKGTPKEIKLIQTANKLYLSIGAQKNFEIIDSKSNKEFIDSKQEFQLVDKIAHFDSSKFKKVETKKTKFSLIKEVKQFFNVSRGLKFIYLLLIFFGMLLASNMQSMEKNIKSFYNINNYENRYVLENGISSELIEQMYRDGLISGFEQGNLWSYLEYQVAPQILSNVSSQVAYYDQSLKLVCGKAPLNQGEIIISKNIIDEYNMIFNFDYVDYLDTTIYLNSDFLDKAFLKTSFKIVGISDTNNQYCYMNKEDLDYLIDYADNFFQYLSFNKQLIVHSTNSELLNSPYLQGNIYDITQKSNWEEVKLNIILSSIWLLICILFSYFILRSKMTLEIYDIGVKRAIGANRLYILKEYLLKTCVLAFMTVIVGYVIYNAFILYVNNSLGLFDFSFLGFFTGLILIVLFMIILGLIPIISLLRKTPIEILNKYDM